MATKRFREGQPVEVHVPDIDAVRGVSPHWVEATYVEITMSGFVRVRMPGRKPGTKVLRAFSPEDVRLPLPKTENDR